MNIYVGNLPHDATEETLRPLFEEYGRVDSVSIITEKRTGQSRGFGFVEMPDHSEAVTAMEALDGREWLGRELTVNEARPRRS